MDIPSFSSYSYCIAIYYLVYLLSLTLSCLPSSPFLHLPSLFLLFFYSFPLFFRIRIVLLQVKYDVLDQRLPHSRCVIQLDIHIYIYSSTTTASAMSISLTLNVFHTSLSSPLLLLNPYRNNFIAYPFGLVSDCLIP